jgi:hypothetical protein
MVGLRNQVWRFIASSPYDHRRTPFHRANNAGSERTIQAPAKQRPAPAMASTVTDSLRMNTPSSNATTGIRNVAVEALGAPKLPAAIAIITFAAAVPKTPNASTAKKDGRVQRAIHTAGNPNGAVKINATPSARHTTGKAPFLC